MRIVALALGLSVALPSVFVLAERAAAAKPITAGVGVGRIQSEADAAGEASDTIQVFGRLGFTPRLSIQVELQRIQDPEDSVDIRTGTALLFVDLGAAKRRLMPTMFAGMGFDRASDDWGYESSGTHIEGGFGLEYRADGGLTIGADIRLGGRSIEDDVKILPAAETGTIAIYSPGSLREGEYRSARITAAVRF